MLNQKQYSNNNLNYDVINIINYTPFYAPSPDFQEIPIIIEGDCNGDRSCEGAQFNGTNIKEIKCNGDISSFFVQINNYTFVLYSGHGISNIRQKISECDRGFGD
eukprot:375544_1